MPGIALIDFHAHILPGADHGSDSTGTSVSQLELLTSAGVGVSVATPHFYPASMTMKDFLRRRADCAASLRSVKRPGWPVIYLGAEVNVCPRLERMPELDRLTVAGTDTLLLEMPFNIWSDELLDTVLAIRSAGFNVVFAHVDRYGDEAVESLFSLGFRGQLNAAAFDTINIFRRRRLLSWIDGDCIVALGSDIHMTDKVYAERLARMCRLLGDERIEKITRATAKYLTGARPL